VVSILTLTLLDDGVRENIRSIRFPFQITLLLAKIGVEFAEVWLIDGLREYDIHHQSKCLGILSVDLPLAKVLRQLFVRGRRDLVENSSNILADLLK